MALTATATMETFHIVSERLSLRKPLVVAVSSNRENIKLIVQPSKSLKEFSKAVALELKVKHKEYPKSVIFARTYQDCTNLYLYIARYLGKFITLPVGCPNLLRHRLVSMYTRASTDEMKTMVMSCFSKENSKLRLAIATSFSMGIDIPDIRQIIHWGPPSDLEQYLQEIGHAGRDGRNSIAALMFGKANRFTKQSMRIYAENSTRCRRQVLFSNFIEYKHDDHPRCTCCDTSPVNLSASVLHFKYHMYNSQFVFN